MAGINYSMSIPGVHFLLGCDITSTPMYCDPFMLQALPMNTLAVSCETELHFMRVKLERWYQMYQQSCPVLLIYPCVECGVNLGNLNVLPKDFKRTYVVRLRGQYLMRKICVNPPLVSLFILESICPPLILYILLTELWAVIWESRFMNLVRNNFKWPQRDVSPWLFLSYVLCMAKMSAPVLYQKLSVLIWQVNLWDFGRWYEHENCQNKLP